MRSGRRPVPGGDTPAWRCEPRRIKTHRSANARCPGTSPAWLRAQTYQCPQALKPSSAPHGAPLQIASFFIEETNNTRAFNPARAMPSIS